MGPLEDSSGCKNTPNCSKAAQEALFLKSSSDCDNCSKTGGTGMTGVEDETGVEMDPLPPVIKHNRTKKNMTNSSRMDKLLQLEKEIDGNETKNTTNATSFKPCPEITSGCGECLANPECGFCRSTKKCMYGTPEGPSGQDNETCPGQSSWNFAECEAPSCASITNCSTCVEAKICGWCPGKGCVEGGSYGPIVGTCDRWINAPNGTCPKVYPKNFTMLMATKFDKGEGSAENVSVGASDNNTVDDNGEESEYAGPEVTGEPDEDAESDVIQRVIARTAHGRKRAKKRIVPLTIEDDAKNTTKFHAAVQREVRKAAKDAESAAKMKFSEKRAYTVVPEIVSSKPHTSKATLKANKNKKWVTVSSSFVELSEGRRGQGIIEAASCVCNGKCEKPMEDAVNCPCDCAKPKKDKIVQAPKTLMSGPTNEKNLPELTPESTVGGGVVANLRMTSDDDQVNETKVAIDRKRCAEAFTAGNKTCFSCADLLGCGFCASEGSCIPGDNNGPYYKNCSEGWHDASFTCSDNPNKDEISVIPTTTIKEDMSSSATGSIEASEIVNGTDEKPKQVGSGPSGPAAMKKEATSGPSGPAPVNTARSSGASGTADDDDLNDEDENDSDKKAANVTNDDKQKERKAEEPISKALKEIEIDAEALNDKAVALLKSLSDPTKVSHPEIDVARYLKQASAISKKLHGIKSGTGKQHDAFVSKLRVLMEVVMKKLNQATDIIAKSTEEAKPKKEEKTAAAATGAAGRVPVAVTGGEEEDDDENQSPKSDASAATGTSSKKEVDEENDDDEAEAAKNPTGSASVDATGSGTGGSTTDAEDAELEKKAARLMKSAHVTAEDTGSSTGNADPAMKAMLEQLKNINKTLASLGKMMHDINASKSNWSATITIDTGSKRKMSNESTVPKSDADVPAESQASGASGASSSGASGPEEKSSSGPSGPAEQGKSGASGSAKPAADEKSGASSAEASGASSAEAPGTSGASGAEASGASGASSSGASGASSSGASGAEASGASGAS